MLMYRFTEAIGRFGTAFSSTGYVIEGFAAPPKNPLLQRVKNHGSTPRMSLPPSSASIVTKATY